MAASGRLQPLAKSYTQGLVMTLCMDSPNPVA